MWDVKCMKGRNQNVSNRVQQIELGYNKEVFLVLLRLLNQNTHLNVEPTRRTDAVLIHLHAVC